jgi:O-antigen ligase
MAYAYDRGGPWRRHWTELPRAFVVVPGAAVVAAIATGFLATQHVKTLELILPVGALAGFMLAIAGLYRFELFVLAVLTIRTVADVTKAKSATNALANVAAPPATASSGKVASVLAVMFILMSVLWLLAQHSAGRHFAVPATDGAFLLFVAASGLSVVGAVHRSGTLTEVARIIAAVMMFLILERVVTTMVQVKRVLVACYLAGAAPVALGALQATTGHGKFVTAGVSRVIGTFLHPNTFGFFLSMFMLMSIALYRHSSERVRLLHIGVVVVCGGMLVLTYSRGSWVAFVLGLLMIGVLQSRKVFGMLIIGGLITIGAVPSVLSRVTNLGSGTTATGSSGNSLAWRFSYWGQVSSLNHNNPITGIGLSGTKYVSDQSKAPHNDYLRAYVETGVVGLLGYLLVLISLVVIAHRALRNAEEGLPRGIAVGFAAVLTAYAVDSFGDNLMSEVVVLWYFYAFAACAVVVARLGRPHHAVPPPSPRLKRAPAAARSRSLAGAHRRPVIV